MKASTLMIQGTSSSVGKSLIVTALCRIFRQDGLNVAPFKAQNMSLNSAVTPDGREIGRAQAAQAAAAGIPPEARMNPILLKPESDRTSQVIVLGKPLSVMDPSAYETHQQELLGVIQDSLENLRERFDLVLIEGAGSPAEVNLMDRDLANMRVAELADAPVLLAADIDRGGVFASLVGTMELLGAHRERVAGFLINKFRGHRELLEPGLDFLTARTGRPVLGVLPYVQQLRLAQEDSLELPEDEGTGPLVAIIRLPYLSNFDEFRFLPDFGLRVRFVERVSDLADAALVILPGSKNVRADLEWMRERGLDLAVERAAASGRMVLGICGGFEMLGQRIVDDLGVEGAPGTVQGLGLLPLVTRFVPEKTTRQVSARPGAWMPELSEGVLSAYEIHHGKAFLDGEAAFFIGGEPEGLVQGSVTGTFLHGLFENEAFCRVISQRLGSKGGKMTDPYDRLAAEIRPYLDMPRLYQLINRKVTR